MNFGQNYYRYRVRILGNGTMDVRIEKSVSNTVSSLTNILPANLTFVAGAKYWIRWEAIGRSPSTNVRMRVWQDGVSEPTTWQASAVVNEPRLDAGGTTGFRFQGPSSSQVNWPVRLSVDDLQYNDRSAFNQNVAAMVREVQLAAQNQLNATFTAPTSSRIKVRVTARDGVPPVLTVNAPTEGTYTRETSILVSGTVVDATPTRVTIDGEAVALDGQGGFAAQIPLAAEGEKVLSIVATDAAGNTSQVQRRVIRDTAPPALSVTSPVDGFITRSDSVLVGGTATDGGDVTVGTAQQQMVRRQGTHRSRNQGRSLSDPTAHSFLSMAGTVSEASSRMAFFAL